MKAAKHKKTALVCLFFCLWALGISFSAFAETVPQVNVVTKSGKGNELIKTQGWIDAELSVEDTAGNILVTEEKGKIKVRGNSTAEGAKKPYNIKFSEKTDLFGFGEGKTYCLLANCYDPAFLRNQAALDLSEQMGLPVTMGHCLIELTIDGVYKGCYLLTEKVEAGESRIDIDTSKGDFFIECEAEREEADVTYVMAGDEFRFAVNEPETPTAEETAHIKEVLDGIYETIREGDYSKIREVIDVRSFADYYVLNEFMKPLDFGYSSTNFYYKDGKLYAGPCWDYDLSSGNLDAGMYPSYWTDVAGRITSARGFWCQKYWYRDLVNVTEFKKEIKDSFSRNTRNMANLYTMLGGIKKNITDYADVYQRNFTPVEEEGAGWDAGTQYYMYEKVPYPTFEENVEYLRSWLSERFIWLSEEFKKNF